MSNGDQLELVSHLLVALVLGGLIGLEREYRGHEAGIRTSSLVCAGAALFGEISVLLGDSRVDQGVVQGIGFLGAGLIFQRGNDVRGVTTATTVWILAGIGLLAARELWLVSILMTVTVVVLLELSPVSDWVYKTGLRRHAHRYRNRGNDEPPKE